MKYRKCWISEIKKAYFQGSKRSNSEMQKAATGRSLKEWTHKANQVGMKMIPNGPKWVKDGNLLIAKPKRLSQMVLNIYFGLVIAESLLELASCTNM